VNTDSKVFGAQRSGNNLLLWLLKANYDVRLSGSAASGCKHGLYVVPNKIGRHLHMIIIAKHPFEWLPSFHRWEVAHDRAPKQFNAFVRNCHPIRYWNGRYEHWLSIDNGGLKKIKVRYDDLIYSQKQTCDRIAKAIGFSRTKGKFQSTVKKMTTRNHPGSSKFDPSYYLKQKYLDLYDRELFRFVRERIDWSIVKRMEL